MIEKSARILLVEDDEDDYVIARDCLEELDEYNFEIDWVSTPNEALEQLKLHQHDICLLDYQLGALNGLTVLEKATDMRCQVPIIMLTGQSDSVLDKSALDAGAVDFIVKNELDSPRFARAIRYAIARQEIQKERLERINLEAKSRSKDQFLAHLSHELRTPLTSILGYTELLLESDRATPVFDELNIILNNGKHLLSLLNDVLDLSKIAAKKLELSPSIVNFNGFLIDLYSLLQVAANDKGIDLEFVSVTSLPEQIVVDPTRLRQILINLINNATKFTEQGSVKVMVAAYLESDAYRLTFEVIDTGCGIPEEKLGNIFQPFEQVADAISRKEVGAGLGLSISSELAAKLGGGICVKSILGEGSCFKLTIRCDKSSNQNMSHLSLTKPNINQTETYTKALSGHVLVVDDIFDIRMLVGHIIASFGLTVDFAENGKLALDKVLKSESDDKCQSYDAIVMDIHMPEMDGKEAVAAIRQRGFRKPIFALTAATMKGVKQELQNLGFDNVISKPVEKTVLYRHLTEILPRQSAQGGEEKNETAHDQTESTLHFLLVEDDLDAAEITKLLLESLGVTVTVAHSAKACKELLNKRAYWDKVLLDYHLPDDNGLKLAKYIFSNQHVGEVVIVSGAELEMSDIQKSGCRRALLKPLNKQKLLSLVNQ